MTLAELLRWGKEADGLPTQRDTRRAVWAEDLDQSWVDALSNQDLSHLDTETNKPMR